MAKAKNYAESKYNDLAKKKEASVFELTEEHQELADNLRETFINLYEYFEKWVFPEYIEWYKNKYLYAGDRAMQLAAAGLSDKSNIKFPLIDAVHDTYFSNTYDADTRIIAVPVEEEDKDSTEAVQNFTERGFNLADADEIIKDLDWEALLVWPGYGRVGFEAKDINKMYVHKGKEKKFSRKSYRPTITYVDAFSLFFEPTGGEFYSKPKFWRNITMSHIIKDKYSEYIEHVSDEEFQYMIDNPDPFATTNYSKIKDLKWFQSNIVNEYQELCDSEITITDTNTDVTFTEQNVYNVDYKTQLMEVVEYWEGDKFVLFINWYLVFDWPSPYPFDGDPFCRMRFGRNPGSMFPKGIAQKLASLQKNIDIFINDRVDVINATANPSFIADKWVFGADTEQVLKLRPRYVYERMPNKLIEPLRLADPAAVNSLLSGIQFYIQQAYEIVGLNSYTQGGEGKIERTAKGSTAKVQILKTALIPFLRNKNHTLSKIGERWLAMAVTFMPDEFKIRVLGKDKSIDFLDIKITDLLGRFDFMYDNNSLKTIARQEEREGLIEALQYVQTPDTRSVLERKLLATFDMEVATLEDKKKEIDELVELEKYKQEQMQWLQQPGAEQQWGQPQQQWAPMEAVPTEMPASEVPAELATPTERQRQVIQE
jgi:hypothetical protein